jgi:hypothetical protein
MPRQKNISEYGIFLDVIRRLDAIRCKRLERSRETKKQQLITAYFRAAKCE